MRFIILLLCTFSISVSLSAHLSIAGVFTSNAVLQQNAEVPIWGWAKPNSQVTIEIANQKIATVADNSGRWYIRLQPFSVDYKAYTLNVSCGNESVQLKNIMFGEVWFASGQSNMEWKLRSGVLNTEQEIAAANFPNIRIHTIKAHTSVQPLDDFSGSEWKICTPANAPDFSAVGYFFAKQLHLDKKIPVGIIVAARGATDIETWMSRDILMTLPDLKVAVQKIDTDTSRWNAKVCTALQSETEREKIANTSEIGLKLNVHTIKFNDAAWNRTEYPLNMSKMGYSGYWGLVWLRKTFDLQAKDVNSITQLQLPIKNQGDRVYINGREIARNVSKMKDQSVVIPKGILKKGGNVLAIRQYVHWGSAEIGNASAGTFLIINGGRKIELNGLWAHNKDIEPAVAQWQNYYNTPTVNYNAMVAPVIPYAIRGFLWYQGENNASRHKQYAALQAKMIDDWRIRWQQGHLPFLYVQLANYKEHSTIPIDKDDWASFRDAQTSILQHSINTAMACAIDIGDANDIHPKNKQAVAHRLYMAALAKAYNENLIYSGPVFNSVKREGKNLRITFYHTDNGLKTFENKIIKGFALKDNEGNWQWVDAKIVDNEVLIENTENAVSVQYAWQSNPEGNLYNAEGLPAVPFMLNVSP